MITIAYNTPEKWSVTIESAKDCGCAQATPDVRSVTVSGDDLDLLYLEFVGLPLPRHIGDWEGRSLQFWWTDAMFILSNIKAAYEVNKAGCK